MRPRRKMDETAEDPRDPANARQLTRRGTLLLAVAGVVSSFTRDVEAAQVEAGEGSGRHVMSAFGDLKYPPDDPHLCYWGRQMSPRSYPHEASTYIRRGPRTLSTQTLPLAQRFPHR